MGLETPPTPPPQLKETNCLLDSISQVFPKGSVPVSISHSAYSGTATMVEDILVSSGNQAFYTLPSTATEAVGNTCILAYLDTCILVLIHMQVCKYASILVCRYASMQVCKYSIMLVCNYAIMQVCKYSSMQVCIFLHNSFD